MFWNNAAGIPTSMSTSTLLKHFERFGKVVAVQRYDTDNKALLQFKTRLVNLQMNCVIKRLSYGLV